MYSSYFFWICSLIYFFCSLSFLLISWSISLTSESLRQIVFLDGGFVEFVFVVVIDEAVCYQETASEFDLIDFSDFSLTLIDYIHLGSFFTAFGFGGG